MCVCLARDTGIIATCGGDTVCLIDCGTGQVMKRFKQPKEVCNGVRVQACAVVENLYTHQVADYLTLFKADSFYLLSVYEQVSSYISINSIMVSFGLKKN